MTKQEKKAALDKRKTAAQDRILAACYHLEAAQNELGRASAAMSALNFGDGEYARIHKLYDKVKEQFYRLSPNSFKRFASAGRVMLDREVDDKEHPHAGCCPAARPVLPRSPRPLTNDEMLALAGQGKL